MENIKQRFLNIAIFILIYLVISGIPFHYFIDKQIIIDVINIFLKLGFIVFSFYYIKKYQLSFPRFNKLKTKHLLFIPFLLITISNFIACFIFKYQQINEFDMLRFLVDMFLCLLVSLCEELCFRVILHSEILKYKKPLISIILSSLIFGLAHLLNINSIASIIPSLIQVIYSFGLGLILALIYTYSSNYVLPVLLHFLFNFINDYLVCYYYQINWDVSFYLTNVVIAIIMLIYGYLLYIILMKGNDNDEKS